MTAVDQLCDELETRAFALRGLGLAFCDPFDELALSQIKVASERLISQLTQDDDDHLSAQTAIDIMATLWPDALPEQCGKADWWQSELGRFIARAAGHDQGEAVTYAVAAAMLGLARGSIGVMIQRGQLDRHPDGGVLRSSVLQRLSHR